MSNATAESKPGAAARLVARLDNWMSSLTGLGTMRDKLRSVRFNRRGREISDDELEALFDEDDMAAMLVVAAPEHMFRQGYAVKTGNPLEERNITEYNERYQVTQRFFEALVWEAVFGGSAIIMGADDGLPMDMPLNLDSLRAIRYINTLDCRDLRPVSYFTDPLAPSYGEPEVYEIITNYRTQQLPTHRNPRIHVSRMIIFPGLLSTARQRRENFGWGNSKLRRSYEPLRVFSANWISATHLLQDASQGVFKVKNLLQIITGGGEEAMHTRMELLDMGRSVARAIMLDADMEDFNRVATSFAELPAMLDRTAQRLAASGRIPVSILMGREPAGMNATGELEVRGWYDTVASDRTQRLIPKMKQFYRVMFRAKDGPTRGVEPQSWDIEFPSLWQPLPSEQADIELKHAQTDALRIQSQVCQPEQIALARFTSDGYQDDISQSIAKTNELLAVNIAATELPTGPSVIDKPGVATDPKLLQQPEKKPAALPPPKQVA